MRIVAIRGANLASLPHFDLDFEADPIRSAGIFAITGPTGAGKSTILDAICLAFFDRLPRLVDAEKGAKISRGEGDASRDVSSADVRNILRHGCGDAFAEVDFIDQSGRKCRARWSVHRSRGRPGGALQAQTIALTDLVTGETIGQGKSETLSEIRRRVGLDFDQFRRAAMLAQNEFDMFIRSDSNTRSSLLERITGTEVYSRISREAFDRAKRDRGAVERIEEQLVTLNQLDEDARQAVEQQIPTLRATIDRLAARRRELEQAKEWYEKDEDLGARVATGEKDLASAERADRLADTEREELVRSRRAFSARSEVDAADGAQRSFDRAVEQSVLSGRANAEAAAILERAASSVSSAQEAMVTTQREYDEIGPELTKATELDARIDEAMKELKRREQICSSAVTRTEVAIRALKEAEDGQASNERQIAALRTWLDEHKPAAVPASRVEEIVKDLREWRVASDEMARVADAISEIDQQSREIADTIERKSSEKNSALERERLAAEEIASIDAALGGINRGNLNATRESAVRAKAQAAEERHWSEDLGKTAATIRQLDDEETEQVRALEVAREDAANAERELPAHQASLSEARRASDISTAAADETVERVRLQLVEGEPCPVCGATEHHFEIVNDILRARVVGDRERVLQLERLVNATMTTKALAGSQSNAIAKDIERLRREHDLAEDVQTKSSPPARRTLC